MPERDSLFQRVTAQDLQPAGWQCEACSRDLQVGDEVVSTILSFTDSTPRDFEVTMTPGQRSEVEDWDQPIPVFGEYRCRSCFEAGREISDAS